MAADKIKIEYVPLSTIARWPRNPKLHDHDALGQSIARFGFVQPLLIDERTGQLVAGHGRLETLQKRRAAGEDPPSRVAVAKDGEWLVPVVRGVSFRDDREAEAYLLADNRLVETGGWDDAALAEMLKGLDVSGIGWTPAEIDRLAKASDPNLVLGIQPSEQLEVFQRGEIKQIVLYFDGAEYDAVLPRLRAVMEAKSLVSHTDVFNLLLEHYEATSSNGV